MTPTLVRALLLGALIGVVGAVVSVGFQLLRVEGQPRHPIGIPNASVNAPVYFAPIGGFPRDDADELVAHYREKFGLTIEVLPTIQVPTDAYDRTRDQLVAEGLIDAIGRTNTAIEDPTAIVIGLTSTDMYIAAKTWRYAYSLRADDRLAVVSTARLGDGLFVDGGRRMRRLQKMITKNIGVLYYRLPQSDDPGSVLYRDILGPQDLDRASEDF